MLKKQIRSLILIGCCLFCITAVSHSSTFNTYYSMGIELFKAKDYPKAYEAFLTAFQLSPGNWKVDFYLGRSAFETENYEAAVMAFKRTLITKPKLVRVKLEIARAYQKLGVNNMAKKYCTEVLLTNPPKIVKENIEKFLIYIDKTEKRHFITSTVTLGVDWDDNVYASPTDSIIDTVIGNVTLTGNSADKKHDWIVNSSAVLNHTYSFPYKDMVWITKGTAAKADYMKEDELDIFYFGMESGFQVYSAKEMFGISLLGDYFEIDSEKYQTSTGIKAIYRYKPAPYCIISPNFQIRKKNNQSNENKDADNISLNLDTAYLVKNMWLNLNLSMENENAQDEEFSYNRYSTNFSVSRELQWDVTLFGNYKFTFSDYKDNAFLFSDERKDKVHKAGVGIRKRFWESQDKKSSASMILQYQYIHSESNIDLYNYRKNIVQAMMEYQF